MSFLSSEQRDGQNTACSSPPMSTASSIPQVSQMPVWRGLRCPRSVPWSSSLPVEAHIGGGMARVPRRGVGTPEPHVRGLPGEAGDGATRAVGAHLPLRALLQLQSRWRGHRVPDVPWRRRHMARRGRPSLMALGLTVPIRDRVDGQAHE